MEPPPGISRKAILTQIGQRLAGPVQAILGYQELVVQDLAASGPEDARADADKVLQAARALVALVADLIANGPGALDDAELHHELRTPVNAILGYSELTLEDFEDELEPAIAGDIRTIIRECGQFLAQLDTLLGWSRGEAEPQDSAVDAGIAESLERVLASPSPMKDIEAGRILVVDDTPANRELLQRQLARRGHEVETAASAAEAVQRLEAGGIDVVLVDILMPEVNGIELLAQLKADPRWRDIPVIMISGLKETQAVVRCIAAGAEDYLEKPIDPVLLHSRVDSCLDRVRWSRREQNFLAQIKYERDRADALLHSMLPALVIRRLRDGETVIADRIDSATVVFADIVDFTPLVARTDPQELLQHLAEIFSRFDELTAKHGVEKIKTIGDGYMAVSGIPDTCADHPERALALAREMIRVMDEDVGKGLSIRVGLHSGPLIAGLVGRLRFVYDVWGESVNLASRLEASGRPGRIHVSEDSFAVLEAMVRASEECAPDLKGFGQVRTFLID